MPTSSTAESGQRQDPQSELKRLQKSIRDFDARRRAWKQTDADFWLREDLRHNLTITVRHDAKKGYSPGVWSTTRSELSFTGPYVPGLVEAKILAERLADHAVAFAAEVATGCLDVPKRSALKCSRRGGHHGA